MSRFYKYKSMMKMKLTQRKAMIVCVIFFLYAFEAMAASNVPTWSTTTDIKAGTLTITTNGAGYGGYYQTTYSSSFSAAPNVGIAIPTIDIVTIPNPMLWKCNLPQSTNTTHFKLSLMYVSTAFRTFKVSYLAVAGNLNYLKVDYLEVGEASLGPLLNGAGTRSITNIKNLGITVNSASNLSIIPYVSGLKINSTSSARQFQITFAKNNNTSVFWTATCYGATTVTQIVAYMLFYDITLGEATQELFLDYQPIIGTNNVRDNLNLFYYNSANLLVGATSFNFTSGFSFNIEPTTLVLTIPSAANFANILFSFWSFRKRNCIAATPYYEKITNLCYDVCPMGYFPVNTPTRYCDSCSTYIAQCTACTSTTVCNQCATGWAVNATFNGCTCAVNFYMSSGSCLATCPNGQWGDDVTRTCVASCTGVKFANPITRTCVTSCPSSYFGDPITLTCVTTCPNGYFASILTQTCVTSCPANYFAHSSSKTCVTQCPVGFFGDSNTKTCVVMCNSPTFGDSTARTCVNTCPNGFFAESSTRTCVTQCPSGLFADSVTKTCVNVCPNGYFAESAGRTCATQCPVGFFGNSASRTCVTQCPVSFYGESSSRLCVTQCPINFFGDPVSLTCVNQCPLGYFGDNISRTCISQCPVGYFGDSSSRTCVTQCPSGVFADNNSRTCVTMCPNGFFGDSMSKACVLLCPDGFFGDTTTNTCVDLCPDGFFGDSFTKMCAQCSDGYFADTVSKTCVTSCPNGYFADSINKACVSQCPVGLFAEIQSYTCVTMCPFGYFGNLVTSQCVLSCPSSPTSMYGDNMTLTCVNSCPSGSFAQNSTRLCVASCWGTTFGNQMTNQCVNVCPSPLYAFSQGSVCVIVCPLDYYGQGSTRTCVQQCPGTGLYRQNSTKICVSSCASEPDTYADDSIGYCVTSCSIGTYADPTSSKCVAQCPTNYFSNSITSQCVQTCPASYFAESTTKSCVTVCPASTIPDNTARACVTCASGTYADAVTNTCAACALSCQTCSGSATNCTSCGATRALSGSTCTCNSGTEDDNGNCISLCTQVGCELCPTDNNVCTQCQSSFILSGGRCHCPSNTFFSIANTACYACHSTCAICSGPSNAECTGCHSTQNRQINTTTFACDCRATFYAPNNEDICIKKPSTTCPQNYVANEATGYCVEICGDGKLFELQCDDGNLENGDGCNSTCRVETNYSCLYGDAQSPSICSYNGRITFELVFAEKDMHGNVIRLEYNLIPQLKFFQKFPNFTSSIKISDPTLNIESAQYSSQTKTLQVKLTYNESATGKVVSISFTPTTSLYSHALMGTGFDWPIRVANGLSLSYYPDGLYGQVQLYDYITLGVYIGSLFVFVLALFFRKMIGVEIIILIQTQVISLSMLKEIHPLLGVLTKDKYAFGYNQFEQLMDMKMITESNSVGLYSVIGFSNIFGENVNVMFFAICVFYFLAIVIGLISSCKQKATAKKMKEAALILAREIAFGLLLFSLMNMMTSYGLEMFAGTLWDYQPEYSGTIKIGSCLVIAANYAVYTMYFKESVESYVFYEKRSRMAQLQPLFIATKAILIAAGIGLYHNFGLTVLYGMMGLQGAYVILIIILRPFKRRVDFVRSIIIQLSLLYVIGSRYILIEYVNLDNPGDWAPFLEYGLIGEHGLVGFSLLMSLISLIFHLFKANKADSQISPEEAHSQFEMQDEKQKQKRSTKHSKSTHYPIQDYLENYLEDEDKMNTNKRRNKLYFENEISNNSMAQLINISDGEGNDSKRRLKEKRMANSMEIIEMDD